MSALPTWVDCPYCEGQYQFGSAHTRRDCIAEVIRAHRFYLDDYEGTAADIEDALDRRSKAGE